MPSTKARLLYLCFEGLPETVFDAQVLGFLKMMAEHGLVFDLFVFEGLWPAFRNRSRNARRLKELQGSWGGKVSYIPLGTKYVFPLAAATFLFSLAQDLKAGNRLILHCRGNYSAFLAALLKKLSRQIFSVYDVRGDVEAEYLYRKASRMKSPSSKGIELKLLTWAEGLALRGADRILCVSSILRARLRQRWNLEGKAIDVIPSCADPKLFRFAEGTRQEVRRELGLETCFILVYSGSMYQWQLIEEIATLTSHLRGRFPDVHLLCLTPDLGQAMPPLAKSLPPEAYTLRHVSHVEMPRYLVAADLGILIRENHPLNQVACPTKFAEYVMCGLPVLVTEGLGDLSELVKRDQLGIVMKDPNDFTALGEHLEGFRKETASSSWKARTAQIGREQFAWDGYAPLLCEIYEKAVFGGDRSNQ